MLDDVIGTLVVVGLLWALIRLLGHGTWVFLASLFGARRPPVWDDRAIRSSRDSLVDLEEQLARCARDRSIDRTTYAAMRAALEAQRKRHAKPAEAAAPAVPDVEEVILTPVEDVVPAADGPIATPAGPSGASSAQRVRTYAAHRAAAAAEPLPPSPPPMRREALSRVFAAFMEEKNIRWGELVGGLLIVGCSIALVISFWAEIAARPFLKFVLLGGVTAALFGVGLYTDRRWKIHTTSHGLLMIATLLVPLNFLAIAAFTHGTAANDALTLFGEAVSTVVFALLVYLAARIVTPDAPALLTSGVMAPSLMQLAVRRWSGISPDVVTPLAMQYALASVPVVCYVATTSVVARRQATASEVSETSTQRFLAFLGLVSAATFFPLALLAWKLRPIEEAVHWLSPLVVWCGVPALMWGLVFWRRVTGRNLTAIQTAGLTVGLLGAGIMAGAVVAAWPDPATLLPVAVMNLIAFAVVAFAFGIPAAHVPAGVALAGAWLVVFHLYRGNITWMLPDYRPLANALLSAASGHALVPLVGVLGIVAGMLRQIGRRDDSDMVALAAAANAAASLALVMWFGFARPGDPQGVTWTLGIYTIAAIAAAAVLNHAGATWAGAAILLLALVQGVVFRWGSAWGVDRPLIAAVLGHATLMLGGVGAVDWWRGRSSPMRGMFQWWAAVSAAVAAALVVAAVPLESSSTLAAYIFWLAGVGVALAVTARWPWMQSVAQVLLLCAAFEVVTDRAAFPPAIPDWLRQLGGVGGWAALGVAAIVTSWFQRRRTVSQSVVGVFAAAVVTLATLAATRWDTGNWLAYRTLLVGCCIAAWLLPMATSAVRGLLSAALVGLGANAWSAAPARWFGAAAVALALGALTNGWLTLWSVLVPLAAIAARNVWIAWHERRRGSMWIAAVLALVTVNIWWIELGHRRFGTNSEGEILEFFWVNVLTAAALALISAWIEIWRVGQRMLPRESEAGFDAPFGNVALPSAIHRQKGLAFHRFAAWAIAAILLLTTVVGLYVDQGGLVDGLQEFNTVLWLSAWFGAAITAVVCWWDPQARWPVACIYAIGLVAVGMFLDSLNFQAPMFQWSLGLALAAYSLGTSFLWSRRNEIRGVLASLRVPAAESAGEIGGGQHWLVAANGLSAIAVVALVAWVETAMTEFGHRMIAAYAVGAEALALGFLARGVVRSPLQYTSLALGALFAVAFAWAWLPVEIAAPWLHRAVAAIVALSVVIVLYGLGLVKLLRSENEWTRAAQRLVPLLAVVAFALLLVVLGIEVVAFAEGRVVPIRWPALVAVTIALVGLAIAVLVAALVPGRDPLGLSERGRTLYVYAAEALAALTFLHIRVTMPWLFTGWFLRFWPLVVMAIAFVGVGVGEFFHRRRQSILGEPLTTTGALLPLLPALGFWMSSSEVHYSLLLLTVGVLYAAVSALRQSFWFAVLAALAANGSLWYLLHTREGLGLAEHPQLWLIPPALCALVAGYLNRERLSAEQSAALRYGSAIVIYASSTADIFINGVADAPWLPAVLALLSILGVFAGILLRVRAFLYLGITFLLVAIMTIIWYAAVEQQRTWTLWVAGIVTGVAIIALFGIFEKRRDDVLRVVERMRQWEA